MKLWDVLFDTEDSTVSFLICNISMYSVLGAPQACYVDQGGAQGTSQLVFF